MWTLISTVNFRATGRRVSRVLVGAAVAVGTVTQVAMAVLPNPALAVPGSDTPNAIEPAAADVTPARFTVVPESSV